MLHQSFPQPQTLSLCDIESLPAFSIFSCADLPSIHRWIIASALHAKQPLFILDGGNVFDGFFLTRFSKMFHHDLTSLFHKIKIARTFTAHQTERAIASLPEHIPEKVSLFIGLDPLATFYDEQIPIPIAEKKISFLGQTLAAAAQRLKIILTIPSRPTMARRAHFSRLLRPFSSRTFILQTYGKNASFLYYAPGSRAERISKISTRASKRRSVDF